VDFAARARRWVEVWQASWPAKDAEAIVGLYATDASYLSVPFRDPDRGVEGVRGYLTREFGVESEIECWFQAPLVDGKKAAIQWWASWIENGEALTLAGSTFLTFDDDGLIIDHRDYWNQIDERRHPYTGWR
jgi:hypothetical protein